MTGLPSKLKEYCNTLPFSTVSANCPFGMIIHKLTVFVPVQKHTDTMLPTKGKKFFFLIQHTNYDGFVHLDG
mgnify:CR=1 FL=1